MGMDRRIGPQFLRAGLGWGGSCFPKDVRALAHMAAIHGTHPQLLRAVIDINSDQRLRTVQKVLNYLGQLEGRKVAVLGATFKAHTDDTRNSPAVELANHLFHEGAAVAIFDPVVQPAKLALEVPTAQVCASLAEAARDADAVLIATDWPEFVELDFAWLRGLVSTPLLVDARNCLDPAAITAAGFHYEGIGRHRNGAARHGGNGQAPGAAGVPGEPHLAAGGSAWRR
jgi:UDPglucose 6-dehydrogenase